MITIESRGNYKKLTNYLERIKSKFEVSRLDRYGRLGVEALLLATPSKTGKTAESWYYTIEHKKNTVSLIWSNSNVVDGVNIAIILQYGHASRNGTWIEGIDYIEPAIRPIFESILEELEREVRRL